MIKKKLGERRTISESKEIFHKEYPYVIPSIYRKVVDEFLVELNLLSHQVEFKLDGIFSVGLIDSFNTFTKGYEPSNNLTSIFISLCSSCGFDYNEIKARSEKIQELIRDSTINSFVDIINKNTDKYDQGTIIPELIYNNNYYTRLHAIGIYKLITEREGEKVEKVVLENKIKEITKKLNFSDLRVKKDLSQYTNNARRIKEALELIEVTIEESKRKSQK